MTNGTAASSEFLEITADNHLKMGGQTFDATVEGGKTVIVSYSGAEGGRFDYTLSGSKVTMSNGSASFASLNGWEFEIKK